MPLDDPQAVAKELAELAARGDTSQTALTRLIDAFASDASWTEENPYYDGLSAREYTLTVAERAREVIVKLGEPAIDAVLARIEAGDARVLQRAATLGPRIVATAAHLLTRGPDTLVPAASHVLAWNIDMFGAADALVNYMRAFDRYVPESTIAYDVLVATWPTFATTDGRAAILARWDDGSLRAWIEAHMDPSPWRVRHLVALLAVVPFEDALPLLRVAFADRDLTLTLEPLLVIDVQRARAVIEADATVRIWAEPVALHIASGGSHWDNGRWDQVRDFGLVEAFATDAVYERLITYLEDQASRGQDIWKAAWRAVAAHVRRDMTRLDHAAAVAITNQLAAAGPGVPMPRQALQIIAELDASRMVAAVIRRWPAIVASKNAYGFIELFQILGKRAADALPHLVEWSRVPPDNYLRDDIARAIASMSE